jgi:hypothetical protein
MFDRKLVQSFVGNDMHNFALICVWSLMHLALSHGIVVDGNETRKCPVGKVRATTCRWKLGVGRIEEILNLLVVE